MPKKNKEKLEIVKSFLAIFLQKVLVTKMSKFAQFITSMFPTNVVL